MIFVVGGWVYGSGDGALRVAWTIGGRATSSLPIAGEGAAGARRYSGDGTLGIGGSQLGRSRGD